MSVANSTSVLSRPPASCAPPDVKASSTRTVGYLERREVLARCVPHLEPRLREPEPRQRTAFRDAEQPLRRRAIVGAAREVVVADAEVALVAAVLLERSAQRVRLVDRVVDTQVEVQTIGRSPDRAGDRLPGHRRVDVRGVIQRRAAGRQRERRAILQQRAAQIEVVLLRLLGTLPRLERVARVHRAVAEAEVHAAAHRPESRLRRDVDEGVAGAVVLGGEHRAEKRIDRICDFGGSLPPRKPSTRIVAPGPAISFSTFSISSGSSGSASI